MDAIYRISAEGEKTLISSTEISENPMIDHQLELEVNAPGKMKFKVLPNHPILSGLRPSDELTFERDGKELFRGELATHDADSLMCGEIQSTGMLGYFNAAYMEPYEYKGTPVGYMQLLLNAYNAKVGANRKIYVGQCTIPGNYIIRKEENRTKFFDLITTKMCGQEMGGYVRVRMGADGKRYLDWLEKSDHTAIQTVEYGKNIVDIAQSIDYGEVYTAVIPLGTEVETIVIDPETGEESTEGTGEKLDLRAAYGSLYVFDADAVATYGWREVEAEFESISSPQELKAKGKEYLQKVKNPVKSFDVKAVDLSGVTDVPAFELMDIVNSFSPYHGLDESFMISKMTLYALRRDAERLTLGEPVKPYSERIKKQFYKVKKTEQDYYQKTEANLSSESAAITRRYTSKIEQTDEAIRLYVGEVQEGLSTEISQTASEIKLEVRDKYATKGSLALSLDEETGIATLAANADVIELSGGELIINSGNLQIDHLGNVIMEGKVISKTGEIGGWTITENKMFAGDASSKVAVIQQPKGGTYVFAAGGTNHNNYSDCPFRVTSDGMLYANRATFENSVYLQDAMNGGRAFEAFYADGGTICFPTDAWLEGKVTMEDSLTVYKNVSAAGFYQGSVSLMDKINTNAGEITKLWEEVNKLKK